MGELGGFSNGISDPFDQAGKRVNSPNFFALGLRTEIRANPQRNVYREIRVGEATCNHEDSLGQ